GIFYGTHTLLQLLPVDILRDAEVSDVAWEIPCVSITDQPRFGWRGMMLDCCRHFMPKEFVKKFIDLLAFYKMNRFHWHLTEDQGWRIEIKQYPKLTEVGSYRPETVVDKTWLTETPVYDGKPEWGFYTHEDVKEIVAYASERFVTVIPEIEMPGHCQAALAAYPELGNLRKKLSVLRQWGINQDVFNVEDSTIEFLKNVLSEVLDLFPSEFIHVGGDECPKDQWRASKAAQAKMKKLGLQNEDELQSWFIRQMDQFLTENGRRLVGWDEILEGGLAVNATVMSWRGEEGGVAAAKAGHDVVMAPHQHVYFDHNQHQAQVDSEVRIGGLITLEDVYAYEPVPAEMSEEEAQHVLGAQGQIWTEYMKNSKEVEWMAFPRTLALAEVLWSPKDKKDYPGFSERFPHLLRQLELMDVNYYRLFEIVD
ncbi:MAG: beta-N-acetylhexosaminidase, partial [Anaerolineaceae bacterium]|nr:beta-N-acetylhexosaminidase [Anaerolineaceae bacterium]